MKAKAERGKEQQPPKDEPLTRAMALEIDEFVSSLLAEWRKEHKPPKVLEEEFPKIRKILGEWGKEQQPPTEQNTDEVLSRTSPSALRIEFDRDHPWSSSFSTVEEYPTDGSEGSTSSLEVQPSTEQNTDEALNRTSPSDLSMAIGESSKPLTEFDTLSTKNTFSSVKEYPRQGSTSSSEEENPQKKNLRKILAERRKEQEPPKVQPSTEQNTDEALNHTSPSDLSMAIGEQEPPKVQPSTEQNTDEALNRTSPSALSMAIGESSKPLQTEFDTLSTTSSVEYFYSEDEYPRQVETDDEEDTTPAEQNIDEALNCTSFSALSYMVSRWFDGWPVSDEHLENLMKSCEDSVAGRGEAFTWIHVYAYFNKKQHDGGYGVLVHNELGVPITASARFSKDGCSFYHQVFEGINAGVTLAGKLGRSHFHVWCNSSRLPSHFDHIYVCRNGKCKDRANADNVCDRCDEYIMNELGCCPKMKLLVLKLRQKDPIEFLFNPAGVAVHYLAKLGKRRRKEAMPPMKMCRVRLNMRFN
ncbi:hypothetical protein MKW92_036373 [Papaver armeniacum]|nr:hypothetical protein MKW92_036373 [Papaver armeniacum]